MSNLLFTRKTAVVALVATAVLGGGAAFAYPSGDPLTVSAVGTPVAGPPASTSVLVTVMNANPGCATRINIDGGPDIIFPAGKSTDTVTIPPRTGTHKIRARTVNCTKGNKEHAKSEFPVNDAKASGDDTSPLNENYEVEFTGLDPDSAVTSTATLEGTTTQLVDSDSVDKRGEATTKFKLRKRGHWVVTTAVSPSGTVNPVTVDVP